VRKKPIRRMKKRGMFCLYSIAILITVLLNACTSQTNFEYRLRTENISAGSSTPLSIQVVDNNIEFALAFQGGGGENEAARLEQTEHVLEIVLLNTDRVSQKILVLYHLSGRINNLESGRYTLQIEDSTGRSIATKSFEVH
jgi:hypothetical protein